MVKLYVGTDHLTVVLLDDFLAFTRKTGEKEWEFQRVVKCGTDDQKSGSIECCNFSPCGKYFGVCYDRNIVIYNTSQWNALCLSPGDRKASCLRFFPKSNVLLFANKSGSAIFYSFSENKLEKLDNSLGHNSMLTDAVITGNEKYVITCDRDEKIRVTNYPNTYNIQQYCLGHTQFVTWMGLLPSDDNVLVSSSGDGTVKFWNFLSGEELAEYSCNMTKTAHESSDNDKTVITKVAMCQMSSFSILAIVEYKSNIIRLLKVSTTSSKSLLVDTMDILSLPSIPWDLTFCNEYMICLLPNKELPMMIWSANENRFVDGVHFVAIQNYLSLNFDTMMKTSQKITDDIPVLFKRDFDNLQEYEQRKKARLLRTGKTS